MIRVLVAEDSPVVQRILVSILSQDAQIEVVGVASNGAQAVRMCREKRPDLVTMDIYMPQMDGLEATRRIMEENPTRIVIISSMLQSWNEKTFEAMRSGAIEIVEKPQGVLSGNYDNVRDSLIRVVKETVEADPMKRFSWLPASPWDSVETPPISGDAPSLYRPRDEPGSIASVPDDFVPDIICIGGSTGAPAVLCDILSTLPANYPIPIVIAQHIAAGFVQGMADWLNSSLNLPVELATRSTILKPGRVFLAPDNAHLKLRPGGAIRIIPSTLAGVHTPSIDVFFQSAAEVYGAGGLGIILSGMGNDGAKGLLHMREAGAVTIAQNEESSVIYGMPKEAIQCEAAILEIDPQEIIEIILKLGERVD